MNTGENKSRIEKAMPYFRLAAFLAVGLLSLITFVFAQVIDPATGQGRNSLPGELQRPEPRSGGHSDYLTSLTNQALASGFGRSSVVVLTPQLGPGRKVIADRLLSLISAQDGRLGRRLLTTSFKETQHDERILSYVGQGAYLEVYTDGTKFRFRGDIDNPTETEWTRTLGKLDEAELESLGRYFISDNLSDFVKLGAGESISFLGTRYLRNGGSDLSGNAKDEVIANVAIFGREVDGVPIVGGGSKIAVWFANDREPVGFDIDWPTYRRTKMTQPILPWEDLKARVEATTLAPSGATQVRISRFECGYVDLGVTRRGGSIQAGCSVSYDGQTGAPNSDGETLKWARIEFVPAGAQVLTDAKWPLAKIIAEGKEPSARSPESIVLGMK